MKEWIITSCAMITIVLIIRRIFKTKLFARIRYGLWLLVLIRLLCPVSFADTGFSVLNFVPREAIVPAENDITPIGTDFAPETDLEIWQEDADFIFSSENPSAYFNQQSEQHTIPASEQGKAFPIKSILLGIWIGGMIVCTVVVLVSNLHFYSKLKSERKFIAVNQSKLSVYVSGLISSPCLFGLLKPVIYVREADRENPLVLQHILLHENMHYRHKDHIWSFLRNICLILHWYNPFVWLAVHFSRQDAEFACDESVTAQLSDDKREEYGQVLISLSAKSTSIREVFCCATTMSGGKKYLKERIKQIAQKPGVLIVPTVIVIALCVVAVCITFTGAKDEPSDTFVLSGDLAGDEQKGLDDKGNIPVTPDADTTSEPTNTEPVEEPIPATFVNDYLVDMNGDGTKDIIRIASVDYISEDADLTTAEGLRETIEKNFYGYFTVTIYDGKKAVSDMAAFEKGDAIDSDTAYINAFEFACAHAGNMQLSFYEEDGRAYLIYNAPYMGQGTLAYRYSVFTYDESWQEVVVAEDSFNYLTEPYHIDSGYYTEYLDDKLFDVDVVVAYTKKLKTYLDKATLLFDTINSVESGTFFCTTYLEDTVRKPDAYAIWYWDERFAEVGDEITLRETLRTIINEMQQPLENSAMEPNIVNVSDIALAEVQAAWVEEPVSHSDTAYPWLFLGIPLLSYEEAATEGEVESLEAILPGASTGTWHTVALDGVEYYYGCYDHAPNEYELFGYALVDETLILENGLHVGMTEQEIMDNYPTFAKLSFEGEEISYYAYNSGTFPNNYAAQFDYYYVSHVVCECVGAEEEHVPVTILLMIKDGKVCAITTNAPTAG